jgi:hypothetical protein
VYDPDGRSRAAASLTAPRDDPARLGVQLAQRLRDQGAEALLRR